MDKLIQPGAVRGIPLGRYVLGPRLAIGGMGEVYLAAQLGMGRFQKPVALKLLLPHLSESPQAIQMFLDEAQLAARMNHPNVVQIFDVGVAEGRHYIAMELVRGVSMSALIQALKSTGGRASPTLLAYVGRALCDGLHHAHEQVDPDGRRLEVVHRDVTPHNVLLSVDGDVKLTDFGIAKARDSATHTRPGYVKGKFEYVAPEQLLGKPLDRRVDLFGAGLTLYHLATLGSPFRRDNELATLHAIERDPLPSLAMLRPDLPRSMREAITKATHKDPNARFPTARAFRDALPPALAEAREELAQLVRTQCGEQLAKLESKTAHVKAIGQATGSMGPEEPAERADAQPARREGTEALPRLPDATDPEAAIVPASPPGDEVRYTERLPTARPARGPDSGPREHTVVAPPPDEDAQDGWDGEEEIPEAPLRPPAPPLPAPSRSLAQTSGASPSTLAVRGNPAGEPNRAPARGDAPAAPRAASRMDVPAANGPRSAQGGRRKTRELPVQNVSAPRKTRELPLPAATATAASSAAATAAAAAAARKLAEPAPQPEFAPPWEDVPGLGTAPAQKEVEEELETVPSPLENKAPSPGASRTPRAAPAGRPAFATQAIKALSRMPRPPGLAILAGMALALLALLALGAWMLAP